MVVIIDYGMGNTNSVLKAFRRINVDAFVSADPDSLHEATKIVLPGVGAFGKAMENLKKGGFIQSLNNNVLTKKKNFLGICLGMQLTAQMSSEMGENKGFSWLEDSSVSKFSFNKDLKIPHIGWNEVYFNSANPLFKNIKNGSDFYFVHSYHYNCADFYVSSTCFYGYDFISSIHKGNIYAVQFHPEKSQEVGLQLLKNFCDLPLC